MLRHWCELSQLMQKTLLDLPIDFRIPLADRRFMDLNNLPEREPQPLRKPWHAPLCTKKDWQTPRVVAIGFKGHEKRNWH